MLVFALFIFPDLFILLVDLPVCSFLLYYLFYSSYCLNSYPPSLFLLPVYFSFLLFTLLQLRPFFLPLFSTSFSTFPFLLFYFLLFSTFSSFLLLFSTLSPSFSFYFLFYFSTSFSSFLLLFSAPDTAPAPSLLPSIRRASIPYWPMFPFFTFIVNLNIFLVFYFFFIIFLYSFILLDSNSVLALATISLRFHLSLLSI